MSKASFTIGGVVYRSMVCTEHMGTVLGMQTMGYTQDPVLSGLDYAHSSNLPAARSAWLRRQIGGTDQWAVSMDSDTWCSARQLHTAMLGVTGDIAIGIVPVIIGGTGRNGMLNIVRSDHMSRIRRDELDMSAGPIEIACGGFGVAVFNLQWFRSHWPNPDSERVSASSEYGEDIEACLAVRRRGGSIYALKVDSWHKDFVSGGGVLELNIR